MINLIQNKNKSNVLQIIIVMITLVLVDSLYLKLVSNHFSNIVSNIQGSPLNLNIFSGILCYIFLAIGLWYFILRENKEYIDAYILGFIIYGVFETTTKALFKKWDWFSVSIDTIWGGCLFMLTTYVLRKFNIF